MKRILIKTSMDSIIVWLILAMILVLGSPGRAFTVMYAYDDAGRLIHVDAENAAQFSYSYDPAGNFTSTTIEACRHHGDVNGSGDITAGDAQMAFAIVIGVITPTYIEECAADCNNDGDITAGDAQQIFGVIFGGTCFDSLEKTK